MQVDVRPDYEVYLRVLSALLIVHAVVSSRMQGLSALVQRQWATPVLFVLPAYAIAIGVDVSDSLPTVAWSAGVGVVLALVNFVDTLLRKPHWGEEAVTSLYAAVNCTLAGLFGMETAVPWYAALAAALLVVQWHTGMPAQQRHPHMSLLVPVHAAASSRSFDVTLAQGGESYAVTVVQQAKWVHVHARGIGQSEGGATFTSALAALAAAHTSGTWTIYQQGKAVPLSLTFGQARTLKDRSFVARQNNPGTLVF
jgi:hypothetical protein